MTNRDVISLTRSRHRLLSADGKVTDRAILKELRSTSFTLIRRETNLRKLWNTNSLFTNLPCVEMEPIALSECCDFISEQKIGRSVLKLPKLGEGYYGYIIKGIFNVEGNRRLTEVTPTRYINLLKLNNLGNNIYVWIGDDNHLYCSDELIHLIKIVAFFEDEPSEELLYPSCNCDTVKPKCENPLDRDFKAPGYLIDNTADIVSQKLLGTYFKLPQDSTNDGRDSQVENT